MREEIARMRARLNITSDDALATRIGIRRSALSRYKTGIPPRDLSRFAELAEAFGVTMDYLWGRVDERAGLYAPTPEIAARIAAIADEAGQLAESLQPTSPGDEQ